MERTKTGGRPKLPDEEKRQYSFHVRLNKEEYDIMETRIKRSRYSSRRQYLLEMSKGVTIRPEVTEVQLFDRLKDIYMEINHIGKNINQISRKINSMECKVPGSVIEYELKKCNKTMETCKHQTEILAEIGHKISSKI